jgi:hypothetical protein
MNKRIWRVLKLNRELRKENKGLRNSLEEARNEIKQRNSLLTFLEERLREKARVDVPYSTMSFVIPNLYLMETTISPISLDRRPRAEYMTKKLTNEMKIKMFDNLFEQGYISKTRDTKDGEVYEIKVVR